MVIKYLIYIIYIMLHKTISRNQVFLLYIMLHKTIFSQIRTCQVLVNYIKYFEIFSIIYLQNLSNFI